MRTKRAGTPKRVKPIVEINGLRFGWQPDDVILDIAALSVDPGEKVFLRGPSGSGKSTLLGLICGVLTPQSGRLSVVGEDFANLGSAKRDALRATHLGVIFQLFNLLPYLSLFDNVTLPCAFSPLRRLQAIEAGGSVEAEARRLLTRLGLDTEDLNAKSVRTLSVGQQQRVAAARALIGAPDLIIADEPTSALDSDTRDAFLALLMEECDRHGSALLFVSHDPSMSHSFDRSIDLKAINGAQRERP